MGELNILSEDKVAIVLLNWNGAQDTIECLESLKNIDFPYYDIYLVDNDSKLESINDIKEYLNNDTFYNTSIVTSQDFDSYTKNEDTNLIFILNDSNDGFAGGNNVAIKYIVDKKLSKYVLLLNNDTIVSKDFINGLLDKLKESKDNGFIGINTYYYHDKNTLQTVGGGLVDLIHGESMAIRDLGEYDTYDFITGSCILIPTSVIKEIGLMNTKFFMYWEDVDWSTIAREHGYKLKVADYGRIYHKEGASIKSASRIYYHTRNRIYYMKRHTTGGQYHKFILYIIAYVLKESLSQLFDKDSYSKSFLKGLKDGLSMVIKE